MKALFFCVIRRATALTLLTLALGSQQPSRAQVLRPAAPAPVAGLRVIVTPLRDSSILRVRYESAPYGSVRLQLRDAQGQVLYTDLIRRSRFAGDFDLAAYPAGTYTLELQTPGAHYAEVVDLHHSSPVTITLVGRALVQAVPAPVL